MKNCNLTFIGFFILLFPLYGICQHEVTSTPTWFKKPPRPNSGKVIGVGKGWSERMNIAEQKAIMSANESIARQINPPLKTKKSFFRPEKRGSQKTTLESETVKASISNSVIIKKAFKKHKDGYLFYIMIEADFQ